MGTVISAAASAAGKADDGGFSQQIADTLLHGAQDDGHAAAVARALHGRARLGHFSPHLRLEIGPFLLDLRVLALAGAHGVHALQDVHPRAVLGDVRDARVKMVHQNVFLLLHLLHDDLHLPFGEICFSLFGLRCHYVFNWT